MTDDSAGSISSLVGEVMTAFLPWSFGPQFTMFPNEDAASLACSCFMMKSLWHFEHMFIVAALPKNPQLFAQSLGASGGAWHPVSLCSIVQFSCKYSISAIFK